MDDPRAEARRSAILIEMEDLATALLHDDRKDDEELPRGAIQDAIEADVVDVGEMLQAFADELAVQLGTRIHLDVLVGSVHRYWSTWCRHGLHGPCGQSRHIKSWTEDGTPSELYDTPREPARCKTCSAPCVCPCHKEVSSG